jgi:hypothetical protein
MAYPDIAQPNTHQLAKHLADFWRSDEITICAERVSAPIICGIGHTHIFGNADGA